MEMITTSRIPVSKIVEFARRVIRKELQVIWSNYDPIHEEWTVKTVPGEKAAKTVGETDALSITKPR